MLSILITKANVEVGRKLAGEGYIYSIDCGDGFMGVNLSPDSISWMH